MSAPTPGELRDAYAGRRVLVTGHTGFKGGWLTLWLHALGANVTGYSLAPDTEPALCEDLSLERLCQNLVADVRDRARIEASLNEIRPDVVFHLAAQSLVRRSYDRPLETIETNFLGTANLLEAIRVLGRPCAVVVVTSDKCYENREWVYGYREDDPLGGHDVYSMSKGAAELLVSSYRRSFFPPARLASHKVAVATARAGNVIGGGDWARDRLVPDVVRALAAGQRALVRNPQAVRPWQHVLEPLGGYLLLGARLMRFGTRDPARFCAAWNFGPYSENSRSVAALATAVVDAWEGGSWEAGSEPGAPHEASLLRLAIDKAQAELGWAPRWGFHQSCARTVEWYRAHHAGLRGSALRDFTLQQIDDYMQVGGPRA